ncbi:MAG: hypothetical protein ACTS77_03650 [Arsenophonus sp. NC-TX2-MAG3]
MHKSNNLFQFNQIQVREVIFSKGKFSVERYTKKKCIDYHQQ